MSERPQAQFSVKALLTLTTLVALLVYALSRSTLLLILIVVLMPSAIGLGIRYCGMWLPDKVRSWLAVILLIGATVALLVPDADRFRSQMGGEAVFVICVLLWLPQLFLMDILIRRAS